LILWQTKKETRSHPEKKRILFVKSRPARKREVVVLCAGSQLERASQLPVPWNRFQKASVCYPGGHLRSSQFSVDQVRASPS
jgi:mRNA degradation ribonuclease J1/J2